MAGNPESGNNKERPSSQEVVHEDEAPGKRYSLSDDAANDLVEKKKVPPVGYKESDADAWIKDSSFWDNFESISWKNGEFLKDFVNDTLLIWSQDKGSIEEVRRAFRMEDFYGEIAEVFVSMRVDGDRYYFDFNIVRGDGTSKKYSLNFARREDIVEVGGEVEFYLKNISIKELIYSKSAKKPKMKQWRVSGES